MTAPGLLGPETLAEAARPELSHPDRARATGSPPEWAKALVGCESHAPASVTLAELGVGVILGLAVGGVFLVWDAARRRRRPEASGRRSTPGGGRTTGP
jgi:hypothetical protein